MNMNAEQENIIKFEESLFINAGAGTGKTRTMVEKYLNLIEYHNVKVDEILAITFTEKAAGEMKERIIRSVEERYKISKNNCADWQKIRNRIPFAWISTVHSFASRMLRENPLESGLDPSFEVIEKHQRKILLKRSLNKYFNDSDNYSSIDEMSQLIRLYKFSGIVSLLEECMENHRSKLKLFVQQNPNYNSGDEYSDAIREFLRVFEIIYEDYTYENKRNNRVDFEEMLFSLKIMLEKFEHLRERIRCKFKYIMVDEFQDTNPLQKNIIDLIKGRDTKVLYVGDGKQSIYKFNGADVSIFNKTAREFDGESVLPLDKNYRSNPHLINFFNLFFPEFIKQDSADDYKIEYQPLKPMKGYDYEKKEMEFPEKTSCVDLLPVVQNTAEEYENIAKYILSEVAQGYRFKDFAILMRNKKNIPEIESTLNAYQIPVYAQSNGSFFSRPEIISLKSFVKALYDPYDESNMIQFLRSYFSPFSDSQLLKIRNEDRKSMYNGLRIFGEKDGSAAEFVNDFKILKSIVNVSSPGRIIRKIINDYDYELTVSTLPDAKGKLENINKFVEFADSFEGKASLGDFLLQSTDEDIEEEEATTENENSDSVRIMTVHRSKGLEFKKVIIADLGLSNPKVYDSFFIDLGNGKLVFKNEDNGDESEFSKYRNREKEMDLEEEKRILYVAFTRAEESIALSLSHRESARNTDNFRYAKMFRDAGLIDENFQWERGREGIYDKYLNIIEKTQLEAIGKLDLSAYNGGITGVGFNETEIEIPATLSNISHNPYKSYISPTPLMSEIIHGDIDAEETEITVEHLVEEIQSETGKKFGTSEKGVFVHKIMENIGKRYGFEEITKKTILEIGNRNGYDIENVEEIYDCFNRIGCNTESLDLFNKMQNSEKVFSEKTIRRKWRKYILSGIIDKMFLCDGKWFVIDFKYSKYNPKTFADNYEFQMEFYLFLLEGLVFPKPECANILYLKEFKIKEVKLGDNFEKRLAEKIKIFENDLLQKEVK